MSKAISVAMKTEEDMFSRLRLDAGARTFGELAQEREWAYREIVSLRERVARYAAKPEPIDQERRAQPQARSGGLRYMRLPEVCERVGIKASGIYRLMQLGRFPKQVKLSERTAAWIESEIESFMDARITERDTNTDTAPSPYMRMGEVLTCTGLKSSELYDLIRVGQFPKWAPLPKIASGWVRGDIEAWLSARSAKSP